MLKPIQLLDRLSTRGRPSYVVVCLVIILAVSIPVAAYSTALEVGRDEGLMLWLIFGFLAPIFETWLFQDLLQEELLRRNASRGKRVLCSWGVAMLMQAFVSPASLVVSAVQNFFYSASYAVWRREGRGDAFLVVLILHLFVNNTLLAMPLWMKWSVAATRQLVG